MRLHQKRQHDDVVAAIETALLNGESQPWMYDVLAMSMRLAGRPDPDVERVLLSRVDFTATEVANMLYSAAYLERFDAHRGALRLYRQASKVAPERPEPWIMSLKLARRIKDWEAVGDAAAGVLVHAWVRDHRRIHEDAMDTAEDARRALVRSGDHAAAKSLSDKIDAARIRDLHLELTWNGEGDLDLEIEEPLGTVCSTRAPYSRGGGVLVHDGSGPNQRNCYDEYVCPRGASGTYRVHVRHIRGNIVGKRAQLTATRYAGTKNESVRRLSVELTSDDVIVQVPLKLGRRKAAKKTLPVRELHSITRAELDRRISAVEIRREHTQSRKAARHFEESRRRKTSTIKTKAGNVQTVAFQPVVGVINDGVTLSTSAIISADRRFVRLSIAPNFSSLVELATFSFATFGNAGGGVNPAAGQ